MDGWMDDNLCFKSFFVTFNTYLYITCFYDMNNIHTMLASNILKLSALCYIISVYIISTFFQNWITCKQKLKMLPSSVGLQQMKQRGLFPVSEAWYMQDWIKQNDAEWKEKRRMKVKGGDC